MNLVQSIKNFARNESIRNFAQDEEGVTAIEYGLIAFLIAVVIIGAVTNVGTALNGVFTTIAGSL